MRIGLSLIRTRVFDIRRLIQLLSWWHQQTCVPHSSHAPLTFVLLASRRNAWVGITPAPAERPDCWRQRLLHSALLLSSPSLALAHCPLPPWPLRCACRQATGSNGSCLLLGAAPAPAAAAAVTAIVAARTAAAATAATAATGGPGQAFVVLQGPRVVVMASGVRDTAQVTALLTHLRPGTPSRVFACTSDDEDYLSFEGWLTSAFWSHSRGGSSSSSSASTSTSSTSKVQIPAFSAS
jgi:hypothetical protein